MRHGCERHMRPRWWLTNSWRHWPESESPRFAPALPQ
jgi:hypothetical protein